MTLVHVAGGTTPSPIPDAKEDSEYVDRCPVHQGEEVTRVHKAGGRDGKGEEYLDWSIFSSDLRNGGCGDTWSRTTRQGAERDRARGVEPANLTDSAATARTVFAPTGQAWEDGYRRAFGHD